MILSNDTKKIVGGSTITSVVIKGALAIVRVIYKIVTNVMKNKTK